MPRRLSDALVGGYRIAFLVGAVFAAAAAALGAALLRAGQQSEIDAGEAIGVPAAAEA